MRRSRKPLSVQADPGFESLSLRHHPLYFQRYTVRFPLDCWETDIHPVSDPVGVMPVASAEQGAQHVLRHRFMQPIPPDAPYSRACDDYP